MDMGENNGARTDGTQATGAIPPPPGMDGPRPMHGPAAPQQAYGQPQGWWYYQPPAYQPAPQARRSSKPKIAGILLIFSGVISIIFGVAMGAMLVGQWPWMDMMESMEGENGELQGEVIFMNNTPAPGVNVTITDLGLMGVTNDTGHYRIMTVKKGWHDVKVELEGYQVLIRSVYVNPSQKYSTEVNVTIADFQLQPGAGELRIGESHTPGTTRSTTEQWGVPFLGGIGAVCMTWGLVTGTLAILGGYFAMQCRRLGVAVAGAICALLFPPMIFGIIAIILLVLSTDEFERQKKEDGLAS